jgi:hypothetical protein
MSQNIIEGGLEIEGKVKGEEEAMVLVKFDEEKYWDDLREEIREFNRKTEDAQNSATDQFKREIAKAIENIEKVIVKLDEEYSGMGVFFMRDIGDVFQNILHNFNPSLYPTSDDFYKYFSIVIGMKDRMSKQVKSNQSHV